MVAFYVFYVAFVVVWHCWLGRRRLRREKEAAARGHSVPPDDELEIEEEYRDDPDDAPSRSSFSRGVAREDWSALERGGETYQDILSNEEDDEAARNRWMSELNSTIRLTIPPARSRQNTLTPVRPSLGGALEFQAVLKSLQKSRNIQTYPLNIRQYSDDPTYTTAQVQDNMSPVSDPAARPPHQVAVRENRSPTVERLDTLDVPPARTRAVSANDGAGLQIDEQIRRPSQDRNREQHELIDFSSRDIQARGHRSIRLQVPQDAQLRPLSSTTPPGSQQRRLLNAAVSGTESRDVLAQRSPASLPRQNSLELPNRTADSHSPRTIPHAKQLSRISIRARQISPSSTPGTSPFLSLIHI